nr:MAG TPA: hypothetical protein [Caudoviricetes sp.]
MGGVNKKYLKKVIDLKGEIYYAKRFCYRVVLRKNKAGQKYWRLERALYEDGPWEGLYKIRLGDEEKPEKWRIIHGAFSQYYYEGTDGPAFKQFYGYKRGEAEHV